MNTFADTVFVVGVIEVIKYEELGNAVTCTTAY